MLSTLNTMLHVNYILIKLEENKNSILNKKNQRPAKLVPLIQVLYCFIACEIGDALSHSKQHTDNVFHTPFCIKAATQSSSRVQTAENTVPIGSYLISPP